MTAFSARLPKKERLKSLGSIQYLFSEKNEKVGKYPLLLFYVVNKEQRGGGVKAMFSVSKKKFPRAVDRNRIKRLMRETYRIKGFGDLQPFTNEQLHLAFVYTGKTIVSFAHMDKSMKNLYDVLTKRFS